MNERVKRFRHGASNFLTLLRHPEEDRREMGLSPEIEHCMREWLGRVSQLRIGSSGPMTDLEAELLAEGWSIVAEIERHKKVTSITFWAPFSARRPDVSRNPT